MHKQVNARAVAVSHNVSNLRGTHLGEIETLMRSKPCGCRDSKPDCCKNCMYYHPDWEHRFCLYAKCKYGRKVDVFNPKDRCKEAACQI